ncbi:hypothetical protein TVAG_391790 [Trichomonas vaginalis G3]|uniref:Uncharacterized protein n=1 Tax=Trichomonas vaginalis (strain ATCC PRA-98 / G3) TaxID=412133 RepID=A2DFU2_TRIV3|nr:hypothetical protein TVAGG3_0322570 [Trichomonas vaginalis G3]EAY20795.1 hypothetical protein TVAG_391790 [Trichomonas vaginalis G3]KAI5529409.1 hypothetical protein TVAGG3_0322570 [Trichomonas vaginalis G3]|eukprot:XP_001581781.1 hypothetical protein [Trichomonas vaginalis G3]
MLPSSDINTLVPEIRRFFTSNFLGLSQSTLRKLFAEMKDHCRNLLIPCQKLLASKVRESDCISISLPPDRKFMFEQLIVLEKQFNNETTTAIEKRIKTLTDIINTCNMYLNGGTKIDVMPCKTLLDVPIETIVADATASTRNCIRSLQTLILSTKIFVVPQSNSSEITKVIQFLRQNSDDVTYWYPRCDDSERLCTYIAKFYKFNFESETSMLSSIFSVTQQLLSITGLDMDYFPTIYFSVYRIAFDISYPRFFQYDCTKNCLMYEHPKEFSESVQTQLNIINNSLTEILLETNPIDIGFHMNHILNVIGSIVNSEREQKGLQIYTFISADIVIDVLESILYMYQFTYGCYLLKIIENFCTHQVFPNSFQYSCQSFRLAILDLMNK